MRRSMLALFAVGLGCAPPKSAQNQTSVSNQKTTSAAVAWSPTIPCAVAIVGDPARVETVCCTPKSSGSNEWSCAVSGAPSASASPK